MTPIEKKIVTISVVVAALMQSLDTTIANVALPHIQGNLSATQDDITWVLTAYMAMAAVTTPLIGWLSSKYGPRNIFLVSIFGFTVSSVLCGVSASLAQIVIFRAMQGTFGAALVPLSQAIVVNINKPEDQKSAMGLWSMSVMVGPVIGPCLGGYLTDNFSWRWVFYINLPLGILSFLGIFYVFKSKVSNPSPFDVIGFSFLAIALLSLQVFLDLGEQYDWFDSYIIRISFVTMISALWVFLIHNFTAKYPFINMSIFKDINFTLGCILNFIIGFLIMGSLSLTPMLLQALLDYPVTTSGLTMAPRGVITILATLLSIKFMNRGIDPRYLIISGIILVSYSILGMSKFNLSITEAQIISNALVQGLGIGLLFISLNIVSLSGVTADKRIEATSIITLVRNVGLSVGISIVNLNLAREKQINHQEVSENINIFNYFSFENIAPSLLDLEVNRQASMIAFLDSFYLMGILALCTIPLILALRPITRAPEVSNVSFE